MLKTIGVLLGVALLATGCSGGASKTSGTSGGGGKSACPLIARLDEIATSVGRADVSDPATFKKSLDAAVDNYAATVHELHPLVPTEVQPDLDQVEASVKQYRFDEARTERSSLDEYAARQCNRTVPTSVLGAGGGTTP